MKKTCLFRLTPKAGLLWTRSMDVASKLENSFGSALETQVRLLFSMGISEWSVDINLHVNDVHHWVLSIVVVTPIVVTNPLSNVIWGMPSNVLHNYKQMMVNVNVVSCSFQRGPWCPETNQRIWIALLEVCNLAPLWDIRVAFNAI